ncbi:MAG: 3-keto-disaccharide hydrolase [Sphingobacterium sp.]
MMKMTSILFVLFFCVASLASYGQETLFQFGSVRKFDSILGGKAGEDRMNWIQVNTTDSTWKVEDSVLRCQGQPIGVVRSERMYQNFIMHVQWRHLEAGGNSGIFVWSDADPEKHNRLPSGVEVQMLELDWVNQHVSQEGEKPPIAYVHGELFGAGKHTTVPDNPRGIRSKSIENRCLGQGQWNSYTVVCVDGTIKLSVNGKFVNGIQQASKRRGYLCLESEGAQIEFRNLQVIELDSGSILAEQMVEEI